MKKILLIILIFTASLYAKGYYIIKLKGGTTIKANAISKENGFIKVYKFGGYIIYPSKNIKSIKFVHINDNTTKNDNQTDTDECVLLVRNFKAEPILNPETGKFNVKLHGSIENNCPVEFKDINLIVQFLGDKRNKIRQEVLKFKKLSPFQKIKINKTFQDVDADLIKYYKYRLEYKRVE